MLADAEQFPLLFPVIREAFAEFAHRERFRLRAVQDHLNDAKAGLGSHLDRHESIGKGTLGVDCFRRIMRSSRFDGIPLILETIDDTIWAEEIRLLRSLETE